MKRHTRMTFVWLTFALLLALLSAGTVGVAAAQDMPQTARASYDSLAAGMTDVSEGDYYYEAVEWALVNGITKGTSADAFSPERICNRAQVVTFLWRAAGEPEPQTGENPFNDITTANYCYDAALWAVEQGIANGTSAHRFSPNMPCTTEQILTFLWRADGSPKVSGAAPVPGAHAWGADAAAWAQASGLLGVHGGALADGCTRGATVWYLYQSTIHHTDGKGSFEDFVDVSLDGGVYVASSASEFVSAAITLANGYEGEVALDGADESYASGRLVVSADGTLPDLTAYHAAQVVSDAAGSWLVQFESAADAEACAAYLESLDFVDYAEPDVLLQTSAQAAGGNALSWGVEATGVGAYAADLAARGVNTDIVVAVVDTGVDASHPFLQGRLVAGYDFLAGDRTPEDRAGHGTHVAGTIVDCTPGTGVKVMPVAVLGRSGGYSVIIAQGIRYAADHGAGVINLSLGGRHSRYMDSAIAYATGRGVTVVAAAGNDNINAAYDCPAHIGRCVTVSAVDSSLRKAGFSNYGSVIDLAAPGVGILSSIPGGGYDAWDGTSMAAPHVSAACALLLCGESRLMLPMTVEQLLKETALDLGSPAYYGAGLLDLTSLIRQNPTEETEPEPEPEPESTPQPQPQPQPTPAVTNEGSCGANITWKLTDGTLTLSGSGVMFDYPDGSQTPWAAQRGSIRIVVIDAAVTGIGAYAFSGCTALVSVSLPIWLESIGAHAFEGCAFNVLEFGGVVNTIGVDAFAGSALTSVTLAGSIDSIGAGAFSRCGGLTTVVISGTVNSIGARAFANCTLLQSVVISGRVDRIASDAFPVGITIYRAW